MYAENFMLTKGWVLKVFRWEGNTGLTVMLTTECLTRMDEMRIAPSTPPGQRLTPKRKPFKPVPLIASAVKM